MNLLALTLTIFGELIVLKCDGLSLSRQEIPTEALFAACIFADLVAVEFFSEKCRRDK
jgi:hypothetical protein